MYSKFLIVVVIYEIEIKGSITLQRLSLFKKENPQLPDILIYDNSKESKYTVKDFITAQYFHNSSNGGVAAAYNYALKIAKNSQKEWLILFDQDTVINEKFFDVLAVSMEQFPEEKVFCPVVRSNNVIVSPTYYYGHKSISLKKAITGVVKSKHYTIINSGLCIHLRKLEELGGYDENLQLDYSDHYLFWRYNRKNNTFVVLDCENLHSLSGYADNTYSAALKRFKLYISASFVFAKKVNSYFPIFWASMRAWKLTFKFSKLDFLRVLLSGK